MSLKSLKNKKKLYIAIITVLLAAVIVACFAYYFAFAWFATNNAVTSTGMIASLNADNGLRFTNTVTAVHYKLTGDTITYTYSVADDGTLTLKTKETIDYKKTKRITFTFENNTPALKVETSKDNGTTWTEVTDNPYTPYPNLNTVCDDDGTTIGYTYTITGDDSTTETYTEYLISEILPDEFIDVTLGFYLEDASLADKGYSITFADFGTDTDNTFYLENITEKLDTQYGVLPAFKYSTNPEKLTYDETNGWGIVETTTDETTGETTKTWKADTTQYTNFHTDGFYYYKTGRDSDYSVTIVENKEWNDNKNGTLTFRIKEDFTEYYKLLNDTTIDADYNNYLSEKIMSIGQIRLSTGTGTGT